MNEQKLAPGLEEFVTLYGIERDAEGCLILYKAVRRNFAPWHIPASMLDDEKRPRATGAYRPGSRVINSAGVDPDRSQSCSFGLHVGTMACAEYFRRYYIGSHSSVVIKVIVRPEDVGCVPCSAIRHGSEEEDQKIRVRTLKVDRIVRRKECMALLNFERKRLRLRRNT